MVIVHPNYSVIKRKLSTASYQDAIEKLNTLQTNFKVLDAIRKSGKKLNKLAIPEMLEWCRRIGYQPENFDKLNIIHITGTKGKGSTCAFVQSILQQYSPEKIKKIGLYTSPHLKSVRERICIDGVPLSKEKFAKYFFQVWNKIESTKSNEIDFPQMGPGVKPVYFRFLTLLSFHTFLSENVDSAIYEVGVGGEYDSTNVINKPIACGITSLALDHTFVLGDTISEIAWHKSGIFKKDVDAYTVSQPEEAMKVLHSRASEIKCPLHIVEPNKLLNKIKLGIEGDFQITNASLAIELAKKRLELTDVQFNSSDNLPVKFIKGLVSTKWKGRCETLQDNNITWRLDGAHTKESISVASNWFLKVARPNTKKVLLFNQQTRDAKSLVTDLNSILENIHFDKVIFSTNITWFSELESKNDSESDVDKLIVQNNLKEAWKEFHPLDNIIVSSSIQEALGEIKKMDGKIEVFATGSLHLVGGILLVLEGEN